MTGTVRLPGVDLDLRWLGDPVRGEIDDGNLTIAAGPRTDMFRDPLERDGPVNAPALLADLAEGDQRLAAHVTVGFRDTYDAGVLLVWVDETRFAKLCLERSPDGRPMIVSVVTRGTSDDANAYLVDRDDWWLRISTLGEAYAFHASADGQRWDLIRYFELGGNVRARWGFQAQSPVGEGCEVVFDRIAHERTRLVDIRDGS